MKKLLPFTLLLIAAYLGWGQFNPPADPSGLANHSNKTLISAYENRQSDVQVAGTGVVAKVLPDDNDGSRHQRFILKLPSGLTLLIAHNIDLAQRLPALKAGDSVAFSGEYEWNTKGGIVHWTHQDPKGRHAAGWLLHKGKKYQ